MHRHAFFLVSVRADWSLQFINYPLLLLAKSCKLVPVMLVGIAVAVVFLSGLRNSLSSLSTAMFPSRYTLDLHEHVGRE